MVPSKLWPTSVPERHPDERGERGDHRRADAGHVTEGPHRERVEVPEDHAHAEEMRHQVGHEEPERRESVEGEGQRPRDDRDERDGQRRRLQEPAHPMLHDQPSVHERRTPEGERQQSEPERKQRAGPIGVLEDLLGRAQVREKRSEHESGAERVSERRAGSQDFEDRTADSDRREGSATADWQRFGLAKREPGEGDCGDCEDGGEYGAPAAKPEDCLAECRSDDRNQDEDGHRERHQPGHLAAFVLIPQHGDGDDARRRGPEALHDAACDHHLERGREHAQQAAGHEEGQARVYGSPSPDAVRKRAKDDLTEPQPKEHRRDDELGVVSAEHPEVAADLGQRRQHRIDRQRDERHQEGDE